MYLPWRRFLLEGMPFPDAAEGIFGMEDVAKIGEKIRIAKQFGEKICFFVKTSSFSINAGGKIFVCCWSHLYI
jgi:hypothetical protein